MHRFGMVSREVFLEALMDQLPALRRYATALTGNVSFADDLVQDCAERALRHFNQLREQSLLPAWLRRILHNLYIDELRRRRQQGVHQDIETFANELEAGAPQPDGGQMRDFLKAVNALSFEQRQILLLAGLEGLGYRQIAEELSLPMGTVMSRLARAREKLRELLETGVPSNVVGFPGKKQP
jgi:RNA polymerase sigma-70 factor, ECF subfamily